MRQSADVSWQLVLVMQPTVVTRNFEGQGVKIRQPQGLIATTQSDTFGYACDRIKRKIARISERQLRIFS
jgi:hypothetical protein